MNEKKKIKICANIFLIAAFVLAVLTVFLGDVKPRGSIITDGMAIVFAVCGVYMSELARDDEAETDSSGEYLHCDGEHAAGTGFGKLYKHHVMTDVFEEEEGE